jgi:aldose 1-epimerase
MTNLYFPDAVSGVPLDIILGYDNLTQYRDDPRHTYFGAIVGRFANRIANGGITLNNVVYHLPLNDKEWDTLHGGDIGYDKRTWNVLEYDKNHIVFQLYDGELVEAFPGDLNVTVSYQITPTNELIIDYTATTQSSTIINLSSHTYWNLNGFKDNDETILDNLLYIGASEYTPVDSHLIPTGTIDSVNSAPWFDFRLMKPIGKDLARSGGYDINLVLDNPSLSHPVLQAYGPVSGIYMDIFTTQPGIQFYSGNGLDGTIPKKADQIFGGGSPGYMQYSGFAAESQHYPDSIHHPEWPTTILNSGETFHQTTIYHFYH